MTVAQLERELSAQELAEWECFDALYPIGDLRADVRSAMLSMLVANANYKKGDGKQFEINDFLLFTPKLAPKEQTVEEQLAVTEQIVDTANARLRNG